MNDMKDLESNKIRKDMGKDPEDLRSSKKKKPKSDDGFAMIIEMSSEDMPKGKDEDIIKKILGD